jgi:hypothetical protein
MALLSSIGTTGRFVQYMSFLQDLEEVVLLGPEVRGRRTAQLLYGGFLMCLTRNKGSLAWLLWPANRRKAGSN